MTDYDSDQDDQEPDRDIWVYILTYDRNSGLTRFCIVIAICALIAWFLANLLTTP